MVKNFLKFENPGQKTAGILLNCLDNFIYVPRKRPIQIFFEVLTDYALKP
jgi:hypothetical protein